MTFPNVKTQPINGGTCDFWKLVKKHMLRNGPKLLINFVDGLAILGLDVSIWLLGLPSSTVIKLARTNVMHGSTKRQGVPYKTPTHTVLFQFFLVVVIRL